MFKKPDGPFCYPLRVDDGKKIREILIKHNIYIPILWPNMIGSHYAYLSENILPLPCDHRYGDEDMKKICDIIFGSDRSD